MDEGGPLGAQQVWPLLPGEGSAGAWEEEATGAEMEARGHRQGRPPAAGRDKEQNLPLSFRRQLGPADTLMSDFWSPDWEGQNKCPVCGQSLRQQWRTSQAPIRGGAQKGLHRYRLIESRACGPMCVTGLCLCLRFPSATSGPGDACGQVGGWGRGSLTKKP